MNIWQKVTKTLGILETSDKNPDAQAKKTTGKQRETKNVTKSAKDIATEKGEPYIAILNMDVDHENLHQGSFELDWNSVFITRLVKAGYMMKPDDTDAEIVDRWFQNVCRNVVMETWEQEEAMNPRFTRSRDLGNGRREVS